jgi:hypothetical protein
MLASIATLALSATVAHAGSGGLPSALTSFFACYSISGKDPGQTVDLRNDLQSEESPIPTPDRRNVRIGGASLTCAIIRMLVPANAKQQFLAEPNPTQEQSFNAIKCYSVSGPGGTLFPGPPGRFDFTDTVWGNLGPLVTVPPNNTPGPAPGSLDTEKGLVISQLKYICGPALITQPQ